MQSAWAEPAFVLPPPGLAPVGHIPFGGIPYAVLQQLPGRSAALLPMLPQSVQPRRVLPDFEVSFLSPPLHSVLHMPTPPSNHTPASG